MKVEFFRHSIAGDDKRELRKVLDSLFLTSGEWTKQFEERLAAYLGARAAVGLTSCTHALELALRYFHIGLGDEVITTPLSFIATANVIEYTGARPVFVDVEKESGNIDAQLVERSVTARTKAILPVHLYGQMCDMQALRAIARRHRLKIIEDAAHCLEGARDGVRVGEFADAACFSFYATKSITSGEGGAISTNDRRAAAWFAKARLHGMSTGASERYAVRYQHYDMEFLGFKCNMSNILAALLIHQLARIAGSLKRRNVIAKTYSKGFQSNPAIRLLNVLPRSKHARHLFTILVDPSRRDAYLHQLQDAGVGVAVNFRAIHLMKYYREKYGYRRGDFPISERIGDSTISLPLYPRLRDKEVAYVIAAVNRIIRR